MPYTFFLPDVILAVQVQQMWSFAHNVNLLAAGGSIPFEGYSGMYKIELFTLTQKKNVVIKICFPRYLGSGIYSGHHGALNAIMSDVPVIAIMKYSSIYLPMENFIYIIPCFVFQLGYQINCCPSTKNTRYSSQ